MNVSNRVIIAVILIIALAFVSESFRHADNDEVIINPEPWDHSPITVYIDNETVPEHYSPTYREDVENALTYWESGGNGQLTYEVDFEIVHGGSADIVIIWTDNLEEDVGVKNGV
ncbi:MAG: peptidase, partial [Methanolobus sp.]